MKNPFKKKIQTPEREPQIIDYRSTSWGHNHTLEPYADGKLRGCCWYGHRIYVGDRMLWKTAYGYAVGKVTFVKSFRDPWDMYQIEVEVIERHRDDSNYW
jgi:hypothetical protein